MRERTLKFSFLLVVIFVCNGVWAQEKGNQYAVKSGHVEYKLTGSTTGTRSLWWDDYGEKEYEETKSVSEIKMMGMVQRDEVHSVVIMVGDYFWSANLLNNTGEKGKIPYYDVKEQFGEDMTEQEAEELGEEILNAMGGERLPSEEFMGYNCDVVTMMGAKSWIYRGVLLKTSAKMMGISINEEAVKFEKDISVPSSKFKPLTNISYKEVSQM